MSATYDACTRTIRVWDDKRRGLGVLEVWSYLKTAAFASDDEAQKFTADVAALLTDSDTCIDCGGSPSHELVQEATT